MNSDNNKARNVQIDAANDGQRIDNYLMSQLKGVPRSHVYRLLRSGQVRVNSGRKKPHYRLKQGDIVRLPPVKIRATESPGIPADVVRTLQDAILLENDDLLVINKPAGLAVHGGSGLAFGVIEALKADGRRPFLELVHRLDRDTSGCLLLAKNRPTLIWLHDLLRQDSGSIGKYYLALVAGHWPGTTTIDAPLAKHRRSGEHMVEVDPDGQAAISHFSAEREFECATLMSVRIETGRTHQIRVHAAHAGHPLAGDPKYGDAGFNRSMKQAGLNRLFLHASRVELPGLDSAAAAPIIIEAPLDPVLQHFLDTLEQ